MKDTTAEFDNWMEEMGIDTTPTEIDRSKLERFGSPDGSDEYFVPEEEEE